MTISDPLAGFGVSEAALRALLGEAATASRDLLRGRPAHAPKRAEGRDIKLVEDEASEALILARLREGSPWPILSEEAGWVGSNDLGPDDPYWAVDPLDGSYNFHQSVPLCCVSVALCAGRRAIAGAIYDFNRDELYVGGAGLGLQVNGEPIERPKRAPAILATGMPVRSDFSDEGARALATRIQSFKKVRMIGSAALSLAWVASGRFDVYEETGIGWWDVAGGVALVEGAGGTASIEPLDPAEPLRGPLAVTAMGAPG